MLHPHIHCIVPGGGLAPTGRWRNCRKGFFLPVAVLAQVFRGKLLDKLGRLFSADLNAREVLRQAARKDWVVHSKPPVAGAEQVLHYLGRYTQRSAISNARILDFADGQVTFRYRDRADANRSKVMTLAAPEFLRRALLHVLPKGFVRIRHYGILSNPRRAEAVSACRAQMAPGVPPQSQGQAKEPWEALLLRLTGKDLTRCPLCATGHMAVREYLPATSRQHPRSRSP
jgi:hypothetical protein